MPQTDRVTTRLQELNALPAEAFEREILACCGSRNWAQQLELRRPFADLNELQEKALAVWHELEESDYLEAFSAHPRIGEKKAEKSTGTRSAAWSAQEQSRAVDSDASVQERLAEGNRRYDEKFGFIFIIFASGRSTEEILECLLQRLPNDRATEIANAAAEQAKITALRLEKLLDA